MSSSSVYRRWAGLAGAIALAAAPRLAAAAPYDIQAVYTVDDQAQPVTATITSASTIPSTGAFKGKRAHLSALRLHVDRSNLGSVAIGAVTEFTVIVDPGGADRREKVVTPISNLGSVSDVTILPIGASFVSGTEPFRNVEIRVHGRFSTDQLCAAETVYREAHGKKRADLASIYPADDPERAAKLAPPYEKGRPPALAILTKDHLGRPVEVLFTFCGKAPAANWKDALDAPIAWAFGERSYSTWQQLSDRHKEELVKLLKSDGILKKFEEAGAKIEVGRDDPTAPADQPHFRTQVFVRGTFSLRVADTLRVRVGELEADGTYRDADSRSHGVFADTSRIVVDGWTAGQRCAPVFGAPFTYRVARKQAPAKGGEVQLSDPFVAAKLSTGRSACLQAVDLSLKQFLDQELRLVGAFRLDGGEELVFADDAFRVAQVGVLVTAPVYSEVKTATRASSAKQFDAVSSIPFSYVHGISRESVESSVAVTFPVRFAYAPRSFTALPKVISVYPHASLLFPVNTTSGTPGTLLVGAGLSVAQFINFAWGFKADDIDQQYLLVGVSLQDIAKLGTN